MILDRTTVDINLKMVNRNVIIEATMRALAGTSEFEEAGITYELMDEIHTRLENLPKDDPAKIRKRSAARGEKKPGVEEGPKRIRGGYQVCDHKVHGSEEFRARVKAYMAENPEKKYMSAKGDVWKQLSEEEQNAFEEKANEVNQENGFEQKEEKKKSSPTVTKAQMEEHNRLLVEELKKAGGGQNIPDMPEREPPKPRKKKSSASNSEELVESPPESPKVSPAPSPDVDDLATMVESVKIGDDSDDDSDDDDAPAVVGDVHKEWCKTRLDEMEVADPNFSKSTADFQGWIMYTQPEKYGPDKQQFVSKEDMKEAKKEHDFKAKKDDSSRAWANFRA